MKKQTKKLLQMKGTEKNGYENMKKKLQRKQWLAEKGNKKQGNEKIIKKWGRKTAKMKQQINCVEEMTTKSQRQKPVENIAMDKMQQKQQNADREIATNKWQGKPATKSGDIGMTRKKK